jgi:catechol 2,3-dioxygenase-like lactoylglutathione lyase family enzyme
VEPIRVKSIDHVALWVEDRGEIAEFLCGHLGAHVIEEGDDFTLLGAAAREGKLTLFDAQGDRDPGVLDRIVLCVNDLAGARAALPADLEVNVGAGSIEFDGPQGIRLGLVKRECELDYDLDHVVLRVPKPSATAAGLAELGQTRHGPAALQVGGRRIELREGDQGQGERPLLNHIAVLVDDAAQMEDRGLEVEKVVDAENTYAVFVAGPDGITIEFVEHKPSFSLV